MLTGDDPLLFGLQRWVKRYFEERGTESVAHLFEEDHLLSCSTLGLIEVAATAARKHAAGAIDATALAAVGERLLDDWGRFLSIELTPEVLERALEVATAHALRGSDSVHLASALVLKKELAAEAGDLKLVTSDHELKAAAQKTGLTVVDPVEADPTLP